MMRILPILIFLCLFCPLAFAQEVEKISIPTGQFDDLKHTSSGRVDKVIDGLTILLKDKKIIRLASIDIPDFNDQHSPTYTLSALKLLEENFPEGTEVMLYQTRMAKKGRLNRMNHELSHIVTKKDAIWAQGLLLAHGVARVYTAPEAPEMNEQMLAAETKARAERLGLWAEGSPYNILTPDTAATAMGRLAIVEGVVQKTATIKNNVYLNFGENWKTDFTVMITPDLRKKLAHKGIDPLNLSQKKIRIRGYVREYNGALIELEAAEHLEYPLLPEGKETPILEATP